MWRNVVMGILPFHCSAVHKRSLKQTYIQSTFYPPEIQCFLASYITWKKRCYYTERHKVETIYQSLLLILTPIYKVKFFTTELCVSSTPVIDKVHTVATCERNLGAVNAVPIVFHSPRVIRAY